MRNGFHHYKLIGLLSLSLFVAGAASKAFGQATAFTYQGRLQDSGVNANGAYDFQFTLWDSLSGGTQQPQPSPATLTRSGVSVANGVFAVQLDFGASAFPGADRFLETSVRSAGSSTFTLLAPRQPVTSTPYAIRSASAASVDNIPVASIPPGNGNYIQNVTGQQANANFNVSGNGTVGGTLSGNAVNSSTTLNIGGNKVVSVTGDTIFPASNTLVGVGAGTKILPDANGDGGFNSFYGFDAGFFNTTGKANSFFGSSAGQSNTTGSSNSFFGLQAGYGNTGGSNNSFFGLSAGFNNTTGHDNSIFGTNAGMNQSGNFNTYLGGQAGQTASGDANTFVGFNTAGQGQSSNITLIGYSASLGSANLSNATAIGAGAVVSKSNSLVLGATGTNVGIGTFSPTARLHVVGDTNLVGNLTVTGTVNATTQYNLSGTRAFSVSGGANQYQNSNTFVGIDAGTFTTPSAGSASGNFNSFLGTGAGHLTTGGGENSFFGAYAGYNNTTGQGNSFFGDFAGNSNATGTNNSFYGSGAGYSNTTASYNSFFGQQSGNSNTTGTSNSFFGATAGLMNNTGNSNSFLGTQAGYFNTTGSGNSFIGAFAGTGNTTGGFNSFFGISAGLSNTTGSNNAFFGGQAGQANATGSSNAFFGTFAGFANAGGGSNAFFGTSAGGRNTTGLNNTFIGNGADFSVSNPTGDNNTLLGGASRISSGISNATAIGASASVAQSNSLVLGSISGVNGATADTNVGIGTTAPSARLHVVGTTGLVGNVGIGTTAPVQPLHVVGNGLFTGSLGIGVTSPAVALEVQRNSTVASDWQTSQLRISGASDPNMQLNLGYDTSSNLGVIQAGQAFIGFKALSLNPFGGNVGIGNTNPVSKLDLVNPNGDGFVRLDLASPGFVSVCRDGALRLAVCSSSLRYKTNVVNFRLGLELVERLRPITFDWKDGGMHDLGLAAEDVEKIDPLLVTYNKEGKVEGVKYDRVGVVLVNAVKEQQAQIEKQQRQINQLIEQVRQLRASHRRNRR